jgi:sortase A
VGSIPSEYKRHHLQFIVFLVSTGVSLLLLCAVTYYWTNIGPHKSSLASANFKNADSSTATLFIPKIHLRAAMVDSQVPSSGMKTRNAKLPSGTPVIEHRDSVFARLPELQIGDEIVVTRRSKEYHYSVQSKTVVGPKDVNPPQPQAKEHLTLVTTYPPSDEPAAQKLVIVATLLRSIELVPDARP